MSEPDPEFLATYHRLSEFGYCDAAGGAECRRVYAEWVDGGKLGNVEVFIRSRANSIPGTEA